MVTVQKPKPKSKIAAKLKDTAAKIGNNISKDHLRRYTHLKVPKNNNAAKMREDLKKARDNLDKEIKTKQGVLKSVEKQIVERKKVIPVKSLVGFSRIHAIITLDIGGIPFAIKHKAVKVTQEKFTWKDRSFPTLTGDISYVDGSRPVVVYDYNKALPVQFARRAKDGPSSAAFNRVFKRNLIEQALGALEKGAFSMNWILALVAGIAIGYVLNGIVGAPPIFGTHAAATATTTTSSTFTQVPTTTSTTVAH